jgi:hypothetical protein
MRYQSNWSKDIPFRDLLTWFVQQRWSVFLLGVVPALIDLLVLTTRPDTIRDSVFLVGPLYFCFFFKPGLLESRFAYELVGYALAFPCIGLMLWHPVHPSGKTAGISFFGFVCWYCLGSWAAGVDRL